MSTPSETNTRQESAAFEAPKKFRESKPRPKITPELLISEQGFNYLKTQAPKIRFKGKGYESQDLQKVMAFYHIWAHSLFPKSDFNKFVSDTKRICRQKRMRIYLDECIRELRFGKQDVMASEMTLEEEKEIFDIMKARPIDDDETMTKEINDHQDYMDADEEDWRGEEDADEEAWLEMEQKEKSFQDVLKDLKQDLSEKVQDSDEKTSAENVANAVTK